MTAHVTNQIIIRCCCAMSRYIYHLFHFYLDCTLTLSCEVNLFPLMITKRGSNNRTKSRSRQAGKCLCTSLHKNPLNRKFLFSYFDFRFGNPTTKKIFFTKNWKQRQCSSKFPISFIFFQKKRACVHLKCVCAFASSNVRARVSEQKRERERES